MYRLPKRREVFMEATKPKKRIAFYCRMNPRRNDYTQFLEPIKQKLDERFGDGEWDMKMFFEIASGAEANRDVFDGLKREIKAKKWDVVITRNATMIARDWSQFLGFMEVCKKSEIEVLSLEEAEDATKQYQCIREFKDTYFGGDELGTS